MAIQDAASSQPASSRTQTDTLPLVLLALAVLAYAAYFSFLTVTRYQSFEARALDMGNLNQAIWNTAHGNWFHLTNQPGIDNRLSLHVEPIILPLALFYRLWPDPRFLLLIQSTVVALGALPTYALARFHLGNAWTALVFAVAFLLHPAIQAANWLEFHPVTLAPTFLLAAFYFLARRRDGWFTLFAVLAASCKEEIALLVFMMGLYAFVRCQRRRLGLMTMILSLGWALLAVLGIQNLFASGNIHWERYGYLGETPGDIVLTMLTQPGLVLAQLRDAGALTYLLSLMLPVAFLSLAGLDLFLLALPSLAINLLADFPPMHQVDTLIYAAPIVPFVLISAVYGADRLVTTGQGRLTRGEAGRTVLLSAVSGMVLLGAVVGQIMGGYLPGGDNYTLYPVTAHHQAARAVIAQIPPEASVSAQDKLDPHVSGRETVYIFPRIEDADMVFLDASGPAWPQHPNDVYTTVKALLDAEWGVVAASDGYLLLARNAPEKEIPAAFYTRWLGTQPASAETTIVEFGERLRLTGYTAAEDPHGELITTLYWQPQKPLDEDLRFYIAYLDSDGTPLHESLFYPPPAALWYPTSLWRPGKTVVMTTLPWDLDADEFTLAVGLYQGESGWTDGARIPMTEVDAGVVPLENETLARLAGFERDGDDGWRLLESQPTTAGPALYLFEDGIELAAATWGGDTSASGVMPPLTLQWRAETPPALDYSIFIHVLDADGNRVAQWDGQPSDRLGPRPMTGWRPGETLVQQPDVPIPAEAPPGDYQVILGIYDWQSGRRLSVANRDGQTADHVVLGTVSLQ